MATGQGRRRNSRRSSAVKSGRYYVDGSVVRSLDVRREIEEAPLTRVSHATRRNREKATHMNVGYVFSLIAAVCFTSAVLIGYISMQAQNTSLSESIAAKESQLNAMKMSNDEEYSRIISSVDLDHVKDVAINELGMQYAKEGQIVSVETKGDDYVRQYQDMP